ncbi:MAG: NADH-quinone oxidoreductase subunit NuoF [Kiritimatiellia bacterium]
MTPEELRALAAETREARQASRYRLNVCLAAGCQSCRGDAVYKALKSEVEKRGIEGVEVCGVGCLGLCAQGPLVQVEPDNYLYQQVAEGDAADIIEALDTKPLERIALPADAPFFRAQKQIVLENSGRIDPDKLEDYLACDGYEGLMRALTEMEPAEVLQEVTRSGLRGRGGGGFPAGLKWTTVAKSRGDKKFIICNGDEGDPGAFMDRSVLESDPHRVLEGMMIAGYAVGARMGYAYIRAEYPMAVKRIQSAIKQAQRAGLLGDGICGTNFNFNVEVRLGAGAFVCGEETALIASIEGKRGQPRPRPPFPAESGLWGFPTLINNVETFANIAPILRKGGEWFASIGTEKSKGTKVFALAGRIRNAGLIEVPMGITLRKIIYDIGGGIPEGRKFKAVQTGGPSGGCIPEAYLDMPVDYDSLMKVGSIMGSGGMIVMDETSCMVDVAKYFMDFCRSESCGKCVPCRAGTEQMHRILAKICSGEATMDDLALLERLCVMVKETSLCGLGQTAPNPVNSTLRYFRDEYLAHIMEKHCPAGVCKMKSTLVEAVS